MKREPFATRYEFLPPAVMQGEPMATAHLYDRSAITVEWRGGGTWTISRGPNWSMNQVWNDMGKCWEYEPLPSNREPEFLERTRYSLVDAMKIAATLVVP